MRLLACLTLATLIPFSTTPLPAQAPPDDAAAADVGVTIEEWPVPWPDTRPRDPAVAADGRVWFVGQKGDYLAAFDAETQEFERIDLPQGSGPHNLVVGPEGRIWYAGNESSELGRLVPQEGTGALSRYPMPESLSDPHTLGFAPDGSLWFTSQWANAIGRFYPESREVDTLAVSPPEARPYGVAVGSDGRPWIALFGTASLATVDPQSMQLETVALPREEARPRRIEIDRNGAVWYTDFATGRLGRLDPADRSVEEWTVPGGAQAAPYAMALDARGRIWFIETGTQPCRLVGFDPRDQAFFAMEAIPSGAGSVRHMTFDQKTQALWFGTDANTLARVIVD